MGIQTSRIKPKNLLLSIIYRLQKILPLSKTAKLKLFLNLEWIFDRLAHEMSFKYYSPLEHPVRNYSKKFILENIYETDTVLDLGCNLGDVSFIIAEKAKEVVGIDHNKYAIEIAIQRHKTANLIFYNREALEFLNENPKHFDVLILSHILEHLDHPKEFLLKFKDFFTRIYIEVPDFDRSYLNHYRKDLNLNLIYSDDDHISEFDRDELHILLNECNIEVFNAEYKFGVQKLWCKVNKNNVT
jgi:SAM-dependent methyltransferase